MWKMCYNNSNLFNLFYSILFTVKDLKCRGKNNYINSLTCQVENSKLETDEWENIWVTIFTMTNEHLYRIGINVKFKKYEEIQ